MNTHFKLDEARPTQPLSVQHWLKQQVGRVNQVLVGTVTLGLSSMPAQAEFLRSISKHQLEIDLIFSETTTQEQREAFELAGLFWSNFLDDDVTLKFYVDMTQNFLPGNVLGGSLPGMQANNEYQDFKSKYQNDITSADDQTAYKNMAAGDRYEVLVPTQNGNRTRERKELDLTRAAAKAVGLRDNNNLGDNDYLDGYITMNSNFNWSYDVLNGPGNNEVDFFSVAVHEIGHQLGFSSLVDRMVADLLEGSANSTSNNVTSSPTSCATSDNDDFMGLLIIEEGEINCIEVDDINLNEAGKKNPQVLDLFRYSQQLPDSFSLAPQTLGSTIDLTLDGNEKFFSMDGGLSSVVTDGTQVYDDLADCQANSSTSGECRTATFSKGLLIQDQNGNTIGDGYQGSHWKQRLQLGTSNAIGIMDPAIGYATTREITGLDLIAFDVVGWDLADGLEEKIETGQPIFDRQALVNALWSEAQQQAANSETKTRADAEPIMAEMLPDSEVYHNCWVRPWLDGCQGGGWQTFLAQKLLAQEVIPTEPEKVPEPTATVGLFSFGLLGFLSGLKRRRPK